VKGVFFLEMAWKIKEICCMKNNAGLVFHRRCGYSKAKQDPDEEKMHFHNGHSKCIRKGQTDTFGFTQSSVG